MTAATGIHPPVPSDDWNAIRSWRKRLREELIRRRTDIAPHARRLMTERACSHLIRAVDWESFEVLAFCWPIKGEYDVRSIAEGHAARGGEVALPVVVAPSAPLEFWRWHPGMPMQTGAWNIPIPKTRHVLTPHVVIAPLVGFDASGYRLGYGGGYFDRTLAAASPRPHAIGLGYSNAELETIYPQPHDMRMNLIVTEKGAFIPK